MYNFPKLFLQITYDFEFNFSHFIPMLGFFFVEKGNLKFSDSKMWWREKSEKILTFLVR